MKNKSIELLEKVYDENKGNSSKQIRELKRFINEGKKSGDTDLIGAAYFYTGYVFYELDDRDNVFTNAFKAVAMLKDSREYNLLARSYIMLGYGYGRQEEYQMEFDCYEKAYALARRHRIKGNVLHTLLNDLSNCYHQVGDCRSAIQLISECIARTKEDRPDDYISLAMYTINLANYHKDNKQPQKAKEVLEEMGNWVGKVKFDGLVSDYFLRMAIISFIMNDTKNGIKYTDRAFRSVPKNMFPHPLYDDLRQISHHLIENGDMKRAKKIHELMKVYAEKNPETIELLIAYRTMAEFYAKNGEEKLAIEYYAKLDSLYETRMSELQKVQFNVHKKMKDADGEILKLNKKIAESEEMATKEPLTKLLNRSTLLRIASDFIDHAAKKNEKVGVIFIDIDFFKECNDTYGHVKGDEILKTVAQACQKEETPRVRFARYGGDEFFGITRGLDDDEVTAIAQRICSRLREEDIPNAKSPNGHRVTLSVGVANVKISKQTDTIIEIANYADKAVYYAKNAGKDSIYLLDYDHRDSSANEAQFVKIEF